VKHMNCVVQYYIYCLKLSVLQSVEVFFLTVSGFFFFFPSQAGWHAAVIPTTLEAQAGASLEPRSSGT
jgi:hypothetical protein